MYSLVWIQHAAKKIGICFLESGLIHSGDLFVPKKHVGSVFSAEHFKVNFSRDPRVNSADSESRIEVSGRRWHMDMALPHLGKSHAQIAQSALLGAQPRDDLFDCYRYSLISDLHHYIPHWRHLRNRLAFTFCK